MVPLFCARTGFWSVSAWTGRPGLHDVYRLDKGGAPTHQRVMAGLALLSRHGVEFNVLATVHAANQGHPLEVYRFLRDTAGATFIQFIPIVERDDRPGASGGRGVHPRSVGGRAYGDFLIAVFDEWVRRDVGRVFVQAFDVALSAWLGQPPGLCVFDEVCGASLAMEHNGDVYSCDHFVEPRHRLGNIGDDDAGRAGRVRAAAAIRPGQARFAAARLPPLRVPVRLQRRVPQGPGDPGAGRRARPQLPLRGLPGLLPAHRRPHALHGRGAARRAAGGEHHDPTGRQGPGARPERSSSRPERSVPLRQRNQVQKVPRTSGGK